MKKTNSFEYQIAADMDALMKSNEFEAMFSKTAMLRQAGKKCTKHSKEECNECGDMADDGAADDNFAKKCPDCKPGKKCDKCAADDAAADDGDADDLADAEDLIGGFNTAVAVALNSLSKVSEVLDEAGLEKTAALSLTLAHNILVEAKSKKLTKEEAKKLKEKEKAKKEKEKAKKDKAEADDKAAKKAKEKAEAEKAKAKAEKAKAKK